MKCPFCGHAEDKVNDSRPIDDGATIRRRRECLNCKQRFTTYEKVEKINLFVIKQDGSRQPFDREKLIQGILKSCVKRPISIEQIENIVNQIENRNSNLLRKEITSTEIGEQVMDKLKDIDEVAYIRFASVYKDFDDLQSFFNELHNIMEPIDEDSNLKANDLDED